MSTTAPKHPLSPLADPNFVPHILQHIFNHLPRKTLIKCLLVSPHFQALAASILYYRIELTRESNPLAGLEVHGEYEFDWSLTPSPLKMKLLEKVRIIDLHRHSEGVCCRYSPLGWIMPKFKVLRLFHSRYQRDFTTSTVTTDYMTNTEEAREVSREGDRPPQVEKTFLEKLYTCEICTILKNTSPTTLLLGDLAGPASSPYPFSPGIMPSTINKIVMVFSGQRSPTGYYYEPPYLSFPIDIQHIVIIFKPKDSLTKGDRPHPDPRTGQTHFPPRTLNTFTNDFADMMVFDPLRRYTIVNPGKVFLEGIDPGVEEYQAEQVESAIKWHIRKKLNPGEVEPLMARVQYMRMKEYAQHEDVKDEFTEEEIALLSR